MQGCTRTPFTEHEQTFSPNGHTNKTSVQPNTNTNTNPTRTRTRTKHEHSFSIPTWGSRKLEPFLSNLVPNWAPFGPLWGPESLLRRAFSSAARFYEFWLPLCSQMGVKGEWLICPLGALCPLTPIWLQRGSQNTVY